MTEKKQKRRGHGEGTLYQRADGRWAAEISLENGKRKTLYAKTRKEAAEKLNQALQEQRQGTLVTAPQQTLETHMNQWLHMKRRELKGGTFAYYTYNVECHINPHLGQVKLQKLAPEHIQGFYTELLEELSPNTVHLIHTILKAALDVAVKWKKIVSNPCLSVTPPRAEKKDIQYVTLEQAKRLMEVAKRHWMIAALIPVAIATGMRRGEMLALTWEDIDFEKKTISITKSLSYDDRDGTGKKYRVETPKTATSKRSVSLPDFAVLALQDHLAVQLDKRLAAPTWEHPELVFTNSSGGYYWYKILTDQFRSILAEAGLPLMPFHGLRHSAATILHTMGVDYNVIKQRLGHSRIATTLDIYSHVTAAMQEEAVDKLNMHFQQSRGE
jgi:integrase